jgi:uncharacterized protein with FMN-binding domain
MRRTAAALAATVVGLWLILTFKSTPTTPVAISGSTGTTAGPAGVTTVPAAGPPPPDGTPTTSPVTTGTRTLTGDVVSNQYGDVQVAVVLNGTKIVDVKALQMPFDRSRSQDISTQAAPLLHDEVIQAQSAQIQTIGGATYTSDSYAQSLQSALDKAHG